MEQRLNAPRLAEGELPDRDWRRHDGLALLHRLGRREIFLVHLPAPPRDQQVSHQQKARAPERDHPKCHCFNRVHARPRHDR